MPPLSNVGYTAPEGFKRGGVVAPKRDKWMNLGMSGLPDQLDITKAARGLITDGPETSGTGSDTYGMGDSEMSGMMNSAAGVIAPAGTAPIGTVAGTPPFSPSMPHGRAASQAASDLERGVNQSGQKVSPNPSIWRALLGAGAQFALGRHSPQAGAAIADILTNTDPSVRRYNQTLQAYQLEKPLSVEERQWQLEQIRAKAENTKAEALRARVAQMGAGNDQKAINEAQKGGFVPDVSLQTPGSPGAPWPQMGGAVNPESVDETLGQVAPGAAGPPAAPPMAGMAGPTQAMPKALGQAGATTPGRVQPPPGFHTTVAGVGPGTMPSLDYLESKKRGADEAAKNHTVTPEEASAIGEPNLAGVTLSEKAWENKAKAFAPEKPESGWEVKTEVDDHGVTRQWRINKITGETSQPTVVGKFGKSKTEPSAEGRGDKSYAQTQRQLDAMSKPITEALARFGRLQDTLAQNSPQADALVAPELLSVMAGGQGSGLRMNEAEIARIVGGRSVWENLRASAQHWSLDPESANSITPDQRQQIHKLANVVAEKLHSKQRLLNDAYSAVAGTDDVNEHRQHVVKTRTALSAIDEGSGAAPSGAVQQTQQGSAIDPQVKAYADAYFGGDIAKAQAAIASQKK